MQAFRKNRRRGAALMLSLWALFLLSAMVISWALDIDSRLKMSGNANRNLQAVALACSGAEVAMHSRAKNGLAALEGGFGRDQRYEARISGEGGRLNMNWLTAIPENPVRLEILRKYLEVKGIDQNERDRMIDTLLDWVDADDLVRLNGAEDGPGYKPANRPLTRLDDLKKIKGWRELTSEKDWDAELTLDSVPGAINLAWADRNVLLALPGADEMRVDQFLGLRRGPDEIDGTEDDGIKNITEVAFALGIPPEQLTQLQVVFLPQDPVLRVVSIGKSGPITRTVRMVILRASNNVQLKSWKEY